MEELYFVYGSALVIALYFLAHVVLRKFDPFAPVWLFLVGYAQVYIVQAISYHEWAVEVRGADLVWQANRRSFWALLCFLAAYHLGAGGWVARLLPRPPRGWSPAIVAALCPPLVLWGLFCAGIILLGAAQLDESMMAGEVPIFRSFAFVMMVAAVLMIVTGRSITAARRWFLPAGLAVAALYVLIWMFNGKRSHSLIGVLATVCAFYVTRWKRPSWPVLLATSFAGALVVAVSIGWRNNTDYERSFAGFLHYVGDFPVAKILESLNISQAESESVNVTFETEEYGGYLLMLDTVPEKSPYDYGANYMRVVSTFIPRIIWPSKPIYGRSEWVSAWMAGSQMERDESFTGPAIGILGAAQLNGGATATLIVLAALGMLLRGGFEYFRLHAELPWTQFWWSITYYNAWFMVVNDDPFVWFYYNWGFTTLPVVVLMWWVSRINQPLIGQEMLASRAT